MPENRSQRLLEGEVIDNGDDSGGELQRLRAELRGVRAELGDLRSENADLKRKLNQANAPVARLRDKLAPFYELLQAIFGDIDDIDPEASGVGQSVGVPGPVQSAAIWESWKSRLPGAPAKIIEALLLHGEANAEQLVVLTQITRKQTIYDAIHRMNKSGIINKNGGRFSLKKLA
jgi:hypothetical protein